MYKKMQRTALLVSVLATLLAVGLSLFGIAETAIAESCPLAEDCGATDAPVTEQPAEKPAESTDLPQTEADLPQTDVPDDLLTAEELAGTFSGRRWGHPGAKPTPDTGNAAEDLPEAVTDSSATELPEEPEDSSAITENSPAGTDTEEDSNPVSSAAVEADALPETEEEDDGFVYYTGIYRPDLQTYLPLNFSRELQKHTFEMAKKYGVSYEIMIGLFGVESGWNPSLYNFDGTCFGLGMLNIAYSRDYYARMGIDMMTPEGNIEASCEVLAQKLKDFDGNLNYALMAYNAGTGGAREMIAWGVRANYYSDSIIRFSENLIPEAEWLEMNK